MSDGDRQTHSTLTSAHSDERLRFMSVFGSYRVGYRKALLDFKEFLEGYSEALTFNKVFTKKSLRYLMSMINERIERSNDLIDFPDKVEWWRKKDGTFQLRVEGEPRVKRSKKPKDADGTGDSGAN